MLVYREEIDGLRSIAIIPVIFYHAGLRTYFSGGYVGVDIFFVISGYLITSVIANECDEEKFSLVQFYERRCRRILPGLFLILFSSSFLAYYLMLPDQLKEFGESLLSILFLSSNIYFWWKDDGYFSQLSELNPLVHTWSLAVEEQFYFLFPILCYLLYRKKFYLILSLISLAGLSFILCQWGGNFQSKTIEIFQMFSQHTLASFYLPIGRIWELLLGALVAFYLRTTYSTKQISPQFHQLFSLFGFILIVISIVFFNDTHIPPFPNLYTLIPTCGAALIILFGENTTVIGYILSTRLLRWIGLISYSAYLWHQPLLAFLRLHGTQTLPISIPSIVLLLVFPLSLFSYFFVEQPFRNKNRFSRKEIFFLSGLASLIIFIMGVFFIRTATNRSLLIDKDGDSYLSDLKKYGHWEYVVRDFDRLQAKKKNFANQSSTFNRRVVVIGDSFAQDFYNMIIEGEHLKNWDFRTYFIYSRCQIYLGNEDRRQFIEAKHKQACTNGNDIKNALPIIRQANVIFLSSNWYLWSAERLPTTLKLLNLTKEQQIFVIGPKHFGKVNPMLYVNKSRTFRMQQYQYPKIEVIRINQLLERTLSQSIYVNMQQMICKGFNQTCPLFTPDGKLISHDGAHLTKYGARYVGNILFRNKPLNKLK